MAKNKSFEAHVLCAAQGWLELGDSAEAVRELNRLSPTSCARLDVLKMRYHAFALAGQWSFALLVAEVATQLFPAAPESWVWRAHATRAATGSALRARDALLPAAARFHDVIICLNLALYEMDLGDVIAAAEWLSEARRTQRRAVSPQSVHDVLDGHPVLSGLWQSLEDLDAAVKAARIAAPAPRHRAHRRRGEPKRAH